MRPLTIAALLSLATTASAALPAPPQNLVDFPMNYAPTAPGPFAANSLLPAPAAINGPITARDGHFFSGNTRTRFLGVNFCFAASFPTHADADIVAARLARFGINIVRFHHMDTQPYPGGLFEGNTDQLSKEALDRLDYLIAALKKNGIYANLNLHVSHSFSRALKLPGANEAPTADKLIDLFDPTLIEAEKKYARELLTHVNPYTGSAYTAEPAVAMIEINNENSLFTWTGEKGIEDLPAPFLAELQQQWNEWLKNKYPSRDALETAWNAGVEPVGPNILSDSPLATAGQPNSVWHVEQHDGAQMSATPQPDNTGVRLTATKLSGPSWHLQINPSHLSLKKDRQYTLTFNAAVPANADPKNPRKITISASQAHDPWHNLGLAADATLTAQPRQFTFYFTANDTDNNARISFALGDALGPIDLSNITLTPGGQQGLQPDEDFTGANQQGIPTVRLKSAETPMTPARTHDWFTFLQSVDQNYFTSMRDFLKNDLHAHAPITGTIGLGALGTLSQSQMDFVDAHAYWQHPHFPGRQWDSHNWTVPNTPMVDSPTLGTFPALAAIRVAGKPFAITEYNHPAPSDWREESVPMLATIAALQDWDAIFLFDYSSNAHYERDHINDFFDIEGDPARMLLMPIAARIFLSGAVKPLPTAVPILFTKSESIDNANRFFYNLWPQLEALHHLTPNVLLQQQLVIAFDRTPGNIEGFSTNPLSWTTADPGTGQFTLHDPHAAVYVGFPQNKDIPLGPLTLTHIDSPFLVATLTPQNPTEPLATTNHLLLTLGARVENHNMKWNEDRTTVGTQWGKGPTQIEPINATLQLPTNYTLTPLDSAGNPLNNPLTGTIDLSTTHTMLYQIDRSPQ